MINNVTLVGRITANPEIREISKDLKVTTFTLAVDKPTSKEDDHTSFIICTAYNKTAEIVCKYVQKGDILGLTGYINTRKYENKDGDIVFVTEVIVNKIKLFPNHHDDDTQPWDEKPAKATKKYAYKK